VTPDIDKIREEIAEVGTSEVIRRADEQLARFRHRQYQASLKPYNEAMDHDQDEQSYFEKG